MFVKTASQVEGVTINHKGFAGFTARYLIAKEDGAVHYAMRMMEIEPGGHTSVHSHPEEHEFYFLEGDAALVDEQGVEHAIKPGDCAYTAADEIHQIKNTGITLLKLVCTIPILPGGDGKSSVNSRQVSQ